MATETPLSGGNLGTVQETYGGKSLNRVVTIGAAIFGCGLMVALLIRWFRPDYPVLATFALGVGVVMALVYLTMNLEAALAKVEVCEGGVRLVRHDVATEVPWDRILKVKVGAFTKVRGGPVEHVVIQTTDGKDIEFRYGFWSAVGGASRFATSVRRFVEDVEEDLDFIRPRERPAMPGGQETVFGVWFGAVWFPCFLGIFVGMTFALRADGPVWEIWAGRAVVALFCWLVSSLSAGFAFHELRRRGEWLPPGATRSAWLAAAAYAAFMLLMASAVVAGFLVCLELIFGSQGRTNG
jgi:hypothetical protein